MGRHRPLVGDVGGVGGQEGPYFVDGKFLYMRAMLRYAWSRNRPDVAGR